MFNIELLKVLLLITASLNHIDHFVVPDLNFITRIS